MQVQVNASHRKRLIVFLIWSTFAFGKCQNPRLYGSEKTTLRLNLANTIWWWQFWCKEDMRPDSIPKFDWELKRKYMPGDFPPINWVGSWISCSSPNSDVIPSVPVPSSGIFPRGYHRFVSALKSPRTTIKYGFLRAIEQRLSYLQRIQIHLWIDQEIYTRR